jgi:hypothetical protein
MPGMVPFTAFKVTWRPVYGPRRFRRCTCLRAREVLKVVMHQGPVTSQSLSPLAQLYGSISTFSIRRDATAVLAGA